MRWQDLRRSSNVRDIRGRRAGAGMPLRLGGRGGIVTIAILVIAFFVGGPEAINMLLSGGASSPGDAPTGAPIDDTQGRFVEAVLGSTEDVWGEIFAASGDRYEPPELVLFSEAVQSACGFADAAVGPFYCPSDRRVYLDTAFFADLERLGGPGDFAQAYVIGHEIGHHIQAVLGTAAEVRESQRALGETAGRRLQVALELQADCYAGVWAHHANRRNRVLEPGDADEALAAAAAIGDDRLQRNAGRRVTPESFTHGSSADRRTWLLRGLESGSVAACDTFDRAP